MGSFQPMLSYTVSPGCFFHWLLLSDVLLMSVSPTRTPRPPALVWPGSCKMALHYLPLLHGSSMMTLDTFYISLLSVFPCLNLNSLRELWFLLLLFTAIFLVSRISCTEQILKDFRMQMNKIICQEHVKICQTISPDLEKLYGFIHFNE